MRPKGIVVNDNKALKQVREDSGHTQKVMASLVGCDERHWRRYENRETGVPEDLLETLQRLAGEGIVKIRDPDGLAEAIGLPGSKKVPAPKNEDQNPAPPTSPNGPPPLPEPSFVPSDETYHGGNPYENRWHGAIVVARDCLGWDEQRFWDSSTVNFISAMRSYLRRHPEDLHAYQVLEAHQNHFACPQMASPRPNPGALEKRLRANQGSFAEEAISRAESNG